MTPTELEEWVLDELEAAQRQEINSDRQGDKQAVGYWRGWQDVLKAVLEKMNPTE